MSWLITLGEYYKFMSKDPMPSRVRKIDVAICVLREGWRDQG